MLYACSDLGFDSTLVIHTQMRQLEEFRSLYDGIAEWASASFNLPKLYACCVWHAYAFFKIEFSCHSWGPKGFGAKKSKEIYTKSFVMSTQTFWFLNVYNVLLCFPNFMIHSEFLDSVLKVKPLRLFYLEMFLAHWFLICLFLHNPHVNQLLLHFCFMQ